MVGVPEITQELERLKPDGSTGADEQPLIVPPVLVGDCEEIATPFVKVNGVPE